ncbi:MAG TPA: hypothetical protein VLG09_04225 [Candidatus Saccharimonadales bacterium]|nr:hypothetical protein [Candidatus Saccharimonadales bacterium]
MDHNKKWLSIGLAAYFALAGGIILPSAWAQPVTQNAISGNECWNAGQGPGGPSQFLCINQVRNGAAFTVVAAVAGTPTTTMTQQQSTLMWNGTAPTTWTIQLPNPAIDGQIVTIGTDTTLTTMVTVSALSTPQNQTLNATYNSQTLTAVTSVEFQYSASAVKWFRLR